MTRQFLKCLFPVVVVLAAYLTTPQCTAQVQSENPSNLCPTAQPCPTVGPDDISCDVAHTVARGCAPICNPVLCNGSAGQPSHDVTRDCRITEADANAVIRELNLRSSDPQRTSPAWFDANQDGGVNALDPLVIINSLNAASCIPTPTPTPVPPPSCIIRFCDGANASANLDVNGDCRITAADAEIVTQELNRRSSGATGGQNSWFDTNRDGNVNPLDALTVTNALNAHNCNPTPTPTVTVTPTSTSVATSSPTRTPTPAATPTSTPNCQYKVNFKYIHDTNMGNDMFRPVGGTNSNISNLLNLSCMQQILCDCYVLGRDAQGRCVPGTDYWSYNPANGAGYSRNGNPLSQGLELLVDECIAIKLGDLKTPGYCGSFQPMHWNTLRDRQRCRTRRGNTHGCNDSNPLNATCTSNQPSSYVILDSQCRSVPDAQATSICGQFEAWTQWTPISLKWSNAAQRSKRLVRFPLNPNAVNKMYEWQGSAEMPLLVYDPRHTGLIVSGTQLFGNWTWGGKRQASLADAPASASGWKNGFEALAELDADRNGKVDGSELEPLGLWFDTNQDGTSQAGEVVTTSHAGVTALFYTPDQEQKNPQEVVASVGFERVVNGKIERGVAVDWFAHESQTKAELALQQQLLNLNQPLTNDHLEKLLKESAVEDNSHAALVGKDRFAGAWKWRIKDDSPNKDRGNLFGTLVIVSDPSTNKVTGHSIIEVPLEGGSPDNPRKLLANSKLSGAFRDSKAGTELVISVLDDKKAIAVSTIRVSADGKKLLGTSTTGESAEHGSLTYEWEAERH